MALTTVLSIVSVLGAVGPPATAAESPPTIEVSINRGFQPNVHFGGHGWSGADVTVEADNLGTPDIDFTSDPVTPGADGSFGFGAVVEGFGAGWSVTASDGTDTAVLAIPSLTVDRVDTMTNEVSGTAEGGLEVEVVTRWGTTSVTASGDGTWSVPADVVRVDDTDVTANWFDEAGGSGDMFSVGYAWPTVGLTLSGSGDGPGEGPQNVGVGGHYWPEGATVHLEIRNASEDLVWEHDIVAIASGELPGENGNGVFTTDVPQADVASGWSLTGSTVVDEGSSDEWHVTKHFVFGDVRIDTVDQQDGSAAGPCGLSDGTEVEPGLTRGHWPDDQELLPLSPCAGGRWATSWVKDPLAVPVVHVGRSDGDWDSAMYIDPQARPLVHYESTTGTLSFLFWDGDVALSIDGAYLTTIPLSGDEFEQVRVEDLGPARFEPGQVLRFDNGTQLKTLVVQDITIDDVAPDGTVTGTAPAGAAVSVQVTDRGGPPMSYYGETVTANESGQWSYVLPADANPLGADQLFQAGLVDFDEDLVFAELSGPPVFFVSPIDNVGQARGFAEGSELTITVDDDDDPSNGVLFETQRQSEGFETHFEFYNEGDEDVFDVQPGHIVTVANPSWSKTHEVTSLMTTDAAYDVVTGMADLGSDVSVEIDGGASWRLVSADGGGNWTADLYAEPTDPDAQWWGSAHLNRADTGSATQVDDDGDGTRVGWKVPDPRLEVDPYNDIVWLAEYPVDTEVTVDVNGAEVGPSTVEPSGQNYWETTGVLDLYPDTDVVTGDVVVATPVGGGDTASLTVSSLGVTGVDTDTDTITGTATAGSTVIVEAQSNEGYGRRAVEADDGGVWTADFGTEPSGEGGEDQWGTAPLTALQGVQLAEPTSSGSATVYRGESNRNLFAFPAEDAVWAFGLSGLGPVEVTVLNESGAVADSATGLWPVRGPSSTTVGDVTFDMPGGENPTWSLVYQLPEGVDLKPGDEVHVTDVLFDTWVTVRDLSVDEADTGVDKLRGRAESAVEAVIAFAGSDAIGFAEPSAGAWSAPLCTLASFSEGGCEPADLGPGDSGIALDVAAEGGDPYAENLTAVTWHLAPELVAVDLPVDPVGIDEDTGYAAVTGSAVFSDLEVPDTHTATWDWGDGAISAGVVTSDIGPGSGGAPSPAPTTTTPRGCTWSRCP